MTGQLDTKMRAVAVDLIDRFGKSVTWIKSVRTATPSTGVVTSVDTNHTVTVSPPSPMRREYPGPTLVQMGDAEVTLAASGLAFTPENGDRLTIDGEKWTVVALQKVYSGSLIAAYTAQIRR